MHWNGEKKKRCDIDSGEWPLLIREKSHKHFGLFQGPGPSWFQANNRIILLVLTLRKLSSIVSQNSKNIKEIFFLKKVS